MVNKLHGVHTKLEMGAQAFEGFTNGKKNLKMLGGRALEGS